MIVMGRRARRRVVIAGVVLAFLLFGFRLAATLFGSRIVASVPSPDGTLVAYAERQGGWPSARPEYRLYLRATPPPISWRGSLPRLANEFLVRPERPVYIGWSRDEVPIFVWHRRSSIEARTSAERQPVANSVLVEGQRVILSFPVLDTSGSKR